MEIKTTGRHRHTPTKVAKIVKTETPSVGEQQQDLSDSAVSV